MQQASNKQATSKQQASNKQATTHHHGWPDHVEHVALGACELRCVLDLEVHDEVEVIPHVVVLHDVLSEGHVLVLKLASG